MFLCIFWVIFSSPLQRSSVIILSFLDLKVSQVSFSVIEENLIVLDSRLHCYSCIWSELVVFLVLKASFQFQIAKCCHYPHFVLKRNLLVIVALKNSSDLRISFLFIIYILRRLKTEVYWLQASKLLNRTEKSEHKNQNLRTRPCLISAPVTQWIWNAAHLLHSGSALHLKFTEQTVHWTRDETLTGFRLTVCSLVQGFRPRKW